MVSASGCLLQRSQLSREGQGQGGEVGGEMQHEGAEQGGLQGLTPQCFSSNLPPTAWAALVHANKPEEHAATHAVLAHAGPCRAVSCHHVSGHAAA